LKGNKSGFSVNLSSGINLVLSAELFLENSFLKGQILSEQKVQHLQDESTKTILSNKILNFISYRHRSRQEIRNKFIVRGYSEKIINSSISKLEELGYIDDNLFAEMFIKSLVKEKKLGRCAVNYKLSPHSLDKNLVSELLDEIYEKYPTKVLLEYHINKFLNVKEKSNKNKSKLYNLLKRKGFIYSEFESVINEIEWR